MCLFLQHSRHWSKLNLRPSGQSKKEPLRKQRLQIKQKGDKVQDIMEYSWEGDEYGTINKKNKNYLDVVGVGRLPLIREVY